MINRMTLRPGIYKPTKLHRQHVSDAIKKWWAVPANKECTRLIQTGIHRCGWSDESKKKISESMKRYRRNRNGGDNNTNGRE